MICPKCIKDFENIPYETAFQYRGLYYGIFKSSSNTCMNCQTQLYETKITQEEMGVLSLISHDNTFYEAMIDLAEKDPIEYQLKMSQFKANIPQQKKESNNQITCPYCKSANVKKISTDSRMLSTGFWGLGSGKIGKQWHCNNCSSDF